MAREVRPEDSIDVRGIPGLLHLAEEVQRSRRPRLLKRGQEELAIIQPTSARRPARRSGIITREDPIYQLIGTGESNVPGGISGDKYAHFPNAFNPQA
jgi:hypothetical protein